MFSYLFDICVADGLWPDYNDGTWPACCTRSDFDEKEVIFYVIQVVVTPLNGVCLYEHDEMHLCWNLQMLRNNPYRQYLVELEHEENV